MNDSKYQTQDEGEYVKSFYLNPRILKMIPIHRCKECCDEFDTKKEMFQHLETAHNISKEPKRLTRSGAKGDNQENSSEEEKEDPEESQEES